MVQLEYADLADADNQARFSDFFAMAEEENLPYPLVVVDGQLRLTGSVHYYQVVPFIEQALQVKNVPH